LKEAPLYQQIYDQLRAAILTRKLKHGVRLPSTRALAREMNISRNTAINAYRQLLAEGYIESVAGSGVYVARVLPDALLQSSTPDLPADTQRPQTPPPHLAEHARRQMAVSEKSPAIPPPARIPHRPFSPEMLALDVFPFALWSRIVVRQVRRLPASVYLYQEWTGYRPLREAIAAHVAVSRQVHCTPDQVIIMPGSQGARRSGGACLARSRRSGLDRRPRLSRRARRVPGGGRAHYPRPCG
jgi:GntR family transcriptional regulator/MocR family aminotransferase